MAEKMNVVCNEEDRQKIFKRDTQLKWNGWGYGDTKLYEKNRTCYFSGNRYEMCGRALPHFIGFMERVAEVNTTPKYMWHSEDSIMDGSIPEPVLNYEFVDFIKKNGFLYSIDRMHRVNRSHGHLLEDIVQLRNGKCKKRIPDIVLWPSAIFISTNFHDALFTDDILEDHNDVVSIVNAANEMNVVIIPLGGGTSVSGAISCPENEERCIVSLDVARMNKILMIDDKNMLCRAQCGITGVDLEEQLKEKGLTVGHEPDSIEFSTLGGWVATRASGIRKNRYGNIEDLAVNVTVVTPKGVINTSPNVCPRQSAGPDIKQVIIGSEGIFGVITEVTIKVCSLSNTRYSAMLVHNLEQGVEFLREITREKCIPAAVRLHDNDQTMMAQSMLATGSAIIDFIVRMGFVHFLPAFFGFNMSECCGIIARFEGSKEEVNSKYNRFNEIARKYRAYKGYDSQGRHGFNVVHAIAYIRDFGLNYCCLGESFETSVVWDKVMPLVTNVKRVCMEESKKMGIIHPVFICCRIAQVYDCGVCLYFYLTLNYQDMFPELSPAERSEEALKMFAHLEELARKVVLENGGSISHHHGVGKLRKKFLPQTNGEVGMSVLKTLKGTFDPKNIFANGNLFDVVSKM